MFPVVSGVCALAIFVTVAIRLGRTSELPFVMSSLAFEGEPWRLASSALPHGSWVHLGFNVIWLWILGTKLEETLGSVTTLALFAVLAVGSEAAQYALDVGGIGLSGIGYGLVGCLWILWQRDRRFADAFEPAVLITFVLWGVLCVAFTMSGIYPVGNIAHAAGFLLGVVIGFAIAPGSLAVRGLAGGVLALLLAGSIAAAALWRPRVNLDPTNAALDDAYFGSIALENKRYADAARMLRRSLALDPDRATTWYNYGIALEAAPDGSGVRAVDAWRRAFALDPFDPQIRDAFFLTLPAAPP